MEVESLIFDSIQPSTLIGKGKHGFIQKCKYQSYVCCYKSMDTEKVDPSKLSKLVQQLHADMNRLVGNPHIIQFIGTCIDNSNRLLVMNEYVSGSSLKSYILRPPKVHPTPNWEIRAKMAYQIAQGLEFLHNHNYVHRNLYSKNILIDFDDFFTAKIGDFGLHDVRDEIDYANQNTRNKIDFYWKAPELDDLKYSSCSKKGDIYALGTVFWELVTNQDAITLTTPSAQQALQGAPEALVNCMVNCLSSNPIDRPSAQELTSTLFAFADQNDNSDFNSEDTSQAPTQDRVATRDMVLTEYPDSAQMVLVNQGRAFMEKQMYVQAAKCFDSPAWNGNAEAQLYLSEIYLSGQGRQRNLRTAVNWLDRAARQGLDRAEYLLALTFYHGIGQRKDRDEAVVILRRIAKKHPPAKLMLAYCYEVGQGIDKDANKALQLYKEMMTENIPLVTHKVADLLVGGNEVELDPAKAIEYYRQAAEQKDLYALYRLGKCYEHGIGTEVSKVQAFKCYDQAAKLAYLPALHSKAICFENGVGANQNISEAAVLYLEAARRGHLASQHQIGHMFQHGRGVPNNHERAVYWYHAASKAGNRSSQNNLGRCYQLGFGTPQNSEMAVYWYRKSADQGCTPAKINLGVCYEKGDGVAKDYTKAFQLYQSASEKGNPHAHYKLGFCFENGIGVEPDLIKALKLYKASGAGGYERGRQRYQDLKKTINPQLLQRARSVSERSIANMNNNNGNEVGDFSFSDIPPSLNDLGGINVRREPGDGNVR